jgi:hypothetical protein
MGARPTGGGHGSEVEGMTGDLDPCIGEATGARAVVTGARRPGEREGRRLEGRGGDGVERATQGQEAPSQGMSSQRLRSAACTCSSRTAAASSAWRAWVQS